MNEQMNEQMMQVAQSAVSLPSVTGNNYYVTGPLNSAVPSGARIDKLRRYYSDALHLRAVWVAEIALIAAGCDPEEAACLASSAGFDSKTSVKILREFLLTRKP